MKILLLGAGGQDCLGSLTQYCSRAFSLLGCKVEMFDLRRSQFVVSKPALAIKEKVEKKVRFSPRKIKLIDFLERQKMNGALLKKALEFQPDIIFTINGERINASTLLKLKKCTKAKLANWFVDPLNSPYHKRLVEAYSGYYDFFFIIDTLDIKNYVKVESAHVYNLPLACEPVFHKRVDLSEEDKKVFGCDVAFVGTMLPRREKILSELTEFNIKIWGPKSNIFGKCLDSDSKLSGFYQGRPVWAEELVKVYNAAKIVLEIHSRHVEPVLSVTQRIFEVVACGGFLVADYVPAIKSVYDIDKEVVCYSGAGELKDKIKLYLEDDYARKTISSRGYERTHREHTYENRMKEVLNRMIGQ